MYTIMIYFDNAATTFPKPKVVVNAVSDALRRHGNPGRGSHTLAMSAAEEIYACRRDAAKMFGASPRCVAFTSGATHSLNIAINAHREHGGNILISDLEHNAVRRPVLASKKQVKIFSSAFDRNDDGRTDAILDSIDSYSKDASMLICTAASNICGVRMPIAEIGEYCRRRGILFIVDGAQAGGVYDINMERDNIDVLCLPAHKGLYGPMGCGLLILSESITLPSFLQGGSGVDSRSDSMPEVTPERYEAGTLPLPAISGLRAGIKAVKSKGIDKIASHEAKLSRLLKDALLQMGVKVYAPNHDGGIVLFNIDGIQSEEVSASLSSAGICTRAGLHCAPLAHDTIGSDGAVRVSFGMYNTENEVKRLISEIGKMV